MGDCSGDFLSLPKLVMVPLLVPNALCPINQIEVPVGRGRPPVLVEKDESLDKVNSFKRNFCKINYMSYPMLFS